MLTTNYRHNMKLRCSLWGKPSWRSWNGSYARQHSFSKEAKLLKEGLPSSSLLSISDSQFPVSKICGAFKMLSGQNCWTWLINLTEVTTSYLVKSSEQSCSPCLASIDSCVESMATHPGCWNSSFLDLSLPALSPTPSETSYHQGSDSGLHPKTALVNSPGWYDCPPAVLPFLTKPDRPSLTWHIPNDISAKSHCTRMGHPCCC